MRSPGRGARRSTTGSSPGRCCASSRRWRACCSSPTFWSWRRSVLSRYVLEASLVWSDDVARALLLGVSFLGAAAALARGENAGVAFFADRLPPGARRFLDAAVADLIIAVAAGFFWNAIVLYQDTAGQTVGAGIPQEAFFLPVCVGAGGNAGVQRRPPAALPPRRDRRLPRGRRRDRRLASGTPGAASRPTACRPRPG